MKLRELRTFNTIDLNTREGATNNSRVISGYAAVFNSRTNIGSFDEIILPGAFSRSLSAKKDICVLVNHNWDNVLGRTKSGTLRLWEDDHGLGFEVELPDTTVARDLTESMSRGDINQCSFGFKVVEDNWDYSVDPMLRTLREVELFEVSIVTVPAYEDTEVALIRSKEANYITGGNYIVRTFSRQQKEVRKAFIDFALGKIKSSEARSLGVDINNGKATIPKTIAEEIIGFVAQENLLRKYGKVVTIDGNLSYPVLTDETDVKVETHSEERDDTNQIVVNHIGLTADLLDPVEFDSISTIKKKLLKTAQVSVSDLVVEVMKKAYLEKEMDYMFNGTGEDAINTGSLFNKAKLFTPTEVEPGEIIREMKRTPSTRVMNKSRWIVNKVALEYLEDIKSADGQPWPMLKTVDRVDAGVSYNLLGFPLDCTDAVKGSTDTSAVFYFGDFSSFTIQENTDGLEVEPLLEKFSHLNEIGFKLYNLLDGKLIYSDLEPTIYRLEI